MYDDEVMDDPKASAKLFEEFYRNFQKHSKNIGLRESVRKKSLIKILFFAKEYLSAEEVAFRIRENYQIKISLPSVYKILSTLEAINIVTIFLTYPGKTKKYKLTSMLHYDHLMCTKCGKVIQFHSEEIEQKQAEVLEKYNFTGLGHTMVLYGLCQECQDAHDAEASDDVKNKRFSL